MADEHYDADGDFSRYMNFDDMEFPTFDEPGAAVLPPVPVEPPSCSVPMAAAHVEPTSSSVPVTHVEHPPADLGLGHPMLVDLGIDVDLDFFPEMSFQPQPSAMNAGGYVHQVPEAHLPHHQQQPLAPLPAHGLDGGQSTTDAARGNSAALPGDHGFFYDPLPDAGPSTDFNFMDLSFSIDDVNIDGVLTWDSYDAMHGGGGGGAGDTPPVDEYANFVRFQPGDINCHNCHLVREVMHANDTRTIYFFVHATGVGSYQHLIVDRRCPAVADGHVPGSELLYFDLTNYTDELASDFITSNVEKLRNDTCGQFLDTGYPNFLAAMELDMLQAIESAPSDQAAADAAPPAAQPPSAPPAAELRRTKARKKAKPTPRNAAKGTDAEAQPAASAAPPAAELPMAAAAAAARKKAKAPPRDAAAAAAAASAATATLLLHLEEFYAAANSRPVPRPDARIILESSQVAQQDGGSSSSTATMYPSMEAKKRKRQVTVTAPSAMTPQRILEYVRVTTQETEKEVGILNSLLKSRKNKEKGDEKIDPISYPLEQVRHIKKKTARILKKASTTMLSRLPASLVDEIDSIKEEKAKAFAELIQVVESLAARKGSLASR